MDALLTNFHLPRSTLLMLVAAFAGLDHTLAAYRHAVRDGYLVEAPTLDALAAKLGIDAAGLRATVARNNAFAASGIDEDFSKGANLYDRNLGDQGSRVNGAGAREHGFPAVTVVEHSDELGRDHHREDQQSRKAVRRARVEPLAAGHRRLGSQDHGGCHGPQPWGRA